MTDEPTASDEFEERLAEWDESVSKQEDPAERLYGLACEQNEALREREAELRAQKARWHGVLTANDDLRAKLEEARAERDRLHDALDIAHTHLLRVEDELEDLPDSVEIEVWEAIREAERALDDFEQGDTVERIRREAFEEAAEKVEALGQEHFYCTQRFRHEEEHKPGPEYSVTEPPNEKCWQNQQKVAEEIRALAGADGEGDA